MAGEAEANAPDQVLPAALFAFYVPHTESVQKMKHKQKFFVKGDEEDQETAASVGRMKSTKDILDRLERFPVTNTTIEYPKAGGHVQVEPEV